MYFILVMEEFTYNFIDKNDHLSISNHDVFSNAISFFLLSVIHTSHHPCNR